MKKTITTLIILGAIGALAFFIYPVIRDRYFAKTAVLIENNSSTSSSTSATSTETPAVENPTAGENAISPTPPEEINQNSTENSAGSGTTGNIKANITPTHCTDDCKAFANDLVLFAYCQQVCGISPVKTNATSCDAKKDLEKDYCLKDLAITKDDAALCKPIVDDNIRKTCRNRIAEDLLEKM